MKCLTLLTENPKNINEEIVKTCLFQFNSLKMALMNSLNKNSLQRNYLIILNHVFHHTVLLPKVQYYEFLIYYCSIKLKKKF